MIEAINDQQFYILQFINPANSATAVFLGVIFGLFILLLIFSGRINRSKNSKINLSFRRRGLRRMARKYGINRHQTSLLTKAMAETNIPFSDRILESRNLLDKMLKHLLISVENSNMTSENKNKTTSEIYDIKRKILNNKNSSHTVKGSNLKLGQEVTIFSKVYPPLNSVIMGNLKSHLVLQTPELNGSTVKYKPGTELKIRINAKGDKVYSFMSKIRQNKIIEDKESILVDHASKIEVDQLRRDMRKPAQIRTLIYRAQVISAGTGRSAVKKLVVNNSQRSLGIIENISRGGAAVLTRLPLETGSIVKLKFNIFNKQQIKDDGNEEDISLFGKVWGSDKREAGGYVNRVGFTRVTTAHLNIIQGYVFGYLN